MRIVMSIVSTFVLVLMLLVLPNYDASALQIPNIVWLCFICVVMVGFIVYEWTATIYNKETPEGMQELEDWLASQGYRRFNGRVKYSNETVIFILGKNTERFLISKDGQEHNGYEYWDYGNYRTVKLANSEVEKMFFVK